MRQDRACVARCPVRTRPAETVRSACRLAAVVCATVRLRRYRAMCCRAYACPGFGGAMSTLMCTDEVSAADRLDYVQALTGSTWVPMEIRSAYRANYWGQFRASGLGAMQVVVLDVMPVTVRRTPPLISQADPDMLKMLLVCGDGSSTVEQDGRQARLSIGEFAFYDTRRPYEVNCGIEGDRPTQIMTFMFPPALLPLARKQIRELNARSIRPSEGLGEVTSQFLLHLARNIDHYSSAEAARLSTAAL